MTLEALLIWLTTPGAGIVTVWLLDHWPWAAYSLNDEQRRWLSLVVSGAIAVAAWWGQVAMLYQPMPSDWRAGVEYGVSLLFAAFGVSQLVHARMKQHRLVPCIEPRPIR